jgi:hypothetical protein
MNELDSAKLLDIDQKIFILSKIFGVDDKL